MVFLAQCQKKRYLPFPLISKISTVAPGGATGHDRHFSEGARIRMGAPQAKILCLFQCFRGTGGLKKAIRKSKKS